MLRGDLQVAGDVVAAQLLQICLLYTSAEEIYGAEQVRVWRKSFHHRFPARPEGGIGLQAVSYTHLDVYKRQGLMAVDFCLSVMSSFDDLSLSVKMMLVEMILC